jgi:GT2 family glycosyltransferase
MSEPRVAVVVLNYNGRELLAEYLPSLTELDYGNYEIVVVDNASSDDSVRFLQEQYPAVSVVQKLDNVGISSGYNAGAEAAPDADYCLFVNNDVRVTPSSLSVLVDRIESKPEVGIVFPRINEMGSETIQSLGLRHDLFGYRGWPELGQGMTESPFDGPTEVVHGVGAAMLVDRDVWAEVGGFDDGNFMYGDDAYLCLQAWVRGHHVEVVPEAVVYHEEDVTLGKNPMQPYHLMRSKTRTYLKTMEASTLLVGFPGFVALFVGQLARDVIGRKQLRVPAYRLAGFLAALATVRDIYRHRRQLRSDREYDDAQYLTPVEETWEPRSSRVARVLGALFGGHGG